MFNFVQNTLDDIKDSLKLLHQLFFCNHTYETVNFYQGTEFSCKEFDGFVKRECSRCGKIIYTDTKEKW
jgi:hypothetical protein